MKDTFTVATFNIFNSRTAIKNRNLTGDNIDLLFTQEDSNYVDLSGTKLKKNNKNMSNMYVKVYSSDKIPVLETNKIKIFKKIKGTNNREAVIVNFKGLKIVGLHLEGGRFVDEELKNNFEELLEYKMKLLKKVVDEDVDIIMGDFNSVFSSNKQTIDEITKKIKKYDIDLQESLKGQYEYYTGDSLKFVKKINNKYTNKKQVNKWNLEPYKYLIDNGYKYLELEVKPINHPKITNARGNSIIDNIWYKPDKVKPLGKGKIMSQFEKINEWKNNKMYYKYSDHNPVIATFDLLN